MEGKDKKKESIDEILSDLNGLLNKMPSILDGIKMPELQPMEAPKPRPEPEPAREEAPPQPEAEKTVVLQPFTGLPEGAPEPAAEIPAQPAEEAADKTVVLEPFSGLSMGDQAPAAAQPEPEAKPAESLTPQSLGDFMFGQDAEPEAENKPESAPAKLSGSVLEPPAEEPVRPAAEKGPSLSISEFNPAAEEPPAVKAAALPAYDNTSDFSIPDIDALMQMSDGGTPEQELPPQALPEAGVIPEAVQAIEERTDGISMQGPSEFTPEPAPEVNTVEQKEEGKDEAAAGVQPQEAAQPQSEEQLRAAEELKASDSAFDAFAIDTTAQEPAPAQGGAELSLETPAADPAAQDAGETLRLDAPSETPLEPAAGEALTLEPAQEAAPQPASDSGDQFGAFPGLAEPAAEAAPAAEQAAPEIPQPEAAAPSAGGIELSPAVNFGAPQPEPAGADQTTPGGSGLELSVGQAPSGADQTIPGGSGLELGGGAAAAGDATLVMPPPSAPSGDEEKTVIFQASPATTSRAQAGDLESLSSRQVPEGIPGERVRPLMFLYSMEDKALCATVLAELDAICLKSAAKPMFIKRASVKVCEPDANPNFVQQSAADCGAQGLICLGNIPPDKVSELESVFAASGGFFRYYDAASFNHSSALDLVTDLILR